MDSGAVAVQERVPAVLGTFRQTVLCARGVAHRACEKVLAVLGTFRQTLECMGCSTLSMPLNAIGHPPSIGLL